MCNSFQNEIRVVFCNLYFLGFTTYHVEQKMSPTGLLFRITSKKISKPLSISTLLPKSKTNQTGKTQCSSEMVVSPHAQTTIHKAAKINSKRYYISLPFFHCLQSSKMWFLWYSTKQVVAIHSVALNETPKRGQSYKAAPADKIWNANVCQKCRNCKICNVELKERGSRTFFFFMYFLILMLEKLCE